MKGFAGAMRRQLASGFVGGPCPESIKIHWSSCSRPAAGTPHQGGKEHSEHENVDAAGREAPGGSARGSIGASTATRQLREAKLVKQREVQHFKVPTLAGDAAEQRGWINGHLAYMRRFDATTTDSLWHWANKSFKVGVKEKDFLDREGRHDLESLMASDSIGGTTLDGRRCLTSSLSFRPTPRSARTCKLRPVAGG